MRPASELRRHGAIIISSATISMTLDPELFRSMFQYSKRLFFQMYALPSSPNSIGRSSQPSRPKSRNGWRLAATRMNLTQLLSQARERFNRRVESALKDVGIGFIQGRSAIDSSNICWSVIMNFSSTVTGATGHVLGCQAMKGCGCGAAATAPDTEGAVTSNFEEKSILYFISSFGRNKAKSNRPVPVPFPMRLPPGCMKLPKRAL